jgi:hypothetical protein
MTDKGICDKCGKKAKLHTCSKCGKSFCKNCLKRSMMGIQRCPLCEGHLE